MKVLKWILIVLIALAALVLIVPAFLPAETTISAETEIAVGPEEVFHYVALFTDRPEWDPWLQSDPNPFATIVGKEEYVGSFNKWEGGDIGSGVIWVNKVIFGKLIQSSIFFGEESDSSLIEWRFKKTDVGANVNWSFTSQGKYPFGRLMLKMMAGEMQSSLEQGLANLKEIIEANPPKLYTTGDFTVEVLPEMHVLMIPASGTMEEITSQFERIFTALFTYTGANNIQVAGPPFAYYIDFDEETGFSNAMIGVHLAEPAKSTGEMIARTFKETKAVTTVHSGKYEYLKDSYGNLTEYAEETGLELTGGAFEIYKKTMMESPNPIDWKTVIAYPIK